MSAKTITVNGKTIILSYNGVRGARGLPGTLVVMVGVWSSEITYSSQEGVVSSEGRAFYSLQDNNLNHAPPSYPTTSNAYWQLFAEKGTDGADGADGEGTGDFMADGSVPMTAAIDLTQVATPSEPASGHTKIYAKSDGKIYRFANGGAEREIGTGGIWTDMPAAITRVSDTAFSMPDASNANLYDKMFDPGTIVRWEKSGGGNQFAVITAAAYSSNAVTYTIMGNTLSAGFSTMKHCIHKAMQDINILPGTCPLAAETGVGKTFLLPYDIYVFGARLRYGTAPTTTKGVWDVNDDGTSIFTTKPEIAASATMGSWQVADCLLATALTAVAADSLITTDYDSGHASTPGADAYVRLLFMPVSWRYRA